MNLKVEYMPVDKLLTYAGNAKRHGAEQIEEIKASITRFGMNDPIAIWKNNEIIEGHGRLIACKELGFEDVPVIRLDDLTDAQRRAYALVHNKLTMNTGFDESALLSELEKITGINMGDFGFDPDQVGDIDYGDLFTDEDPTKGMIQCPNCGEWFEP